MNQSPDIDEPRLHPWVWVVFLVLFAVSVPWYLPSHSRVPLLFGLPYWVVISFGASFAIAVFTAWVISHYWSDDEPDHSKRNHGSDL